jgi:hypothetical protein
MSEDLHYRFPPAAAYRLNHCLYAIKSDPDFCARFLADQSAACADMSLSEGEARALAGFDRDELVGLGGHPYLVFMADLRLRIAREPGSLEYF